MTQTNTNQQAIAGVKNVMMVTIARIENAHTLMWITTKVKWSFISYVKVGLNGKKYGHTKEVTGLTDTNAHNLLVKIETDEYIYWEYTEV